MQYREDKRSGNRLSVLGFGCMRFPGGFGRIDRDKTEALLLQAYESGVNYYDTAYLYQGSEAVIGEVFEKHGIREQVYIATKLPQSMCKKASDFDKFFAIQKERLRTDYVDYYFMHNFTDYKQWENLVALGIEDWLAEKKASGEVRQAGFSFHGSQPDFFRILDAYDWDFVQIQYNYINVHYQAGLEGMKRAAEKGLPVFIMEPLLGGKLADGLPREAVQKMRETRPEWTPVSWALRWLWNQPEVTLLLSGMNAPAQLEENVRLAQEARPGMVGDEETQVLEQVVDIFNQSYKIPCTGCNYCMPCPKGINIPACFSAYNTSYAVDWMTGISQYVIGSGAMSDQAHYVSDCVECGKCESHCPQGIAIRRGLKSVRRRLQVPGMKTALSVYRKVT
ncbi:MAG: aldo/keto reductase [Clostridiales bacterium]|nr:aldo/keto reductase [Clostridiales bacterium]